MTIPRGGFEKRSPYYITIVPFSKGQKWFLSSNWGYFGLKMVMYFLVRPLPENHAVPSALANPATATTKPNLSTSETDKKTCLKVCMEFSFFSCLKLVWKLKFDVVIETLIWHLGWYLGIILFLLDSLSFPIQLLPIHLKSALQREH